MKMKMRIGQLTLRAGMALALWGMLALGLFDVGTARAADSAAADAFVRYVQAETAVEHVDVHVDNSAQALLTGFTFSNVTDYMPLAAGTHTIQVVPTGQANAKAIITQSVNVQAGTFYTIALTGDQGTQPALVVFTDGASVPTGKADLRVYHLSGDAGPIAVTAAGTTLIDRLTFKSASPYVTLDTNQTILEVILLNKNNQSLRVDATLQADKISSVFVLGLTSIVDSIGFKSVTKVTASVPSALPTTGFAPASSYDGGIPGPVYVLVSLAALALLGGTRLALARRLPDAARSSLPHPVPVEAIPDHSREVKASAE